ncbi:transcriptional regulator [Candidatus Campbellbacteria bacterium]|nr:MAG: transcriptional regulator [Candidatus Campbellbacteria bacterium]
MNKKKEKDLNQYPVGKNCYDLTPILDKEFGKPGTKRAEKSLERIFKEYRARDLKEKRQEAKKTQQEVADILGKDVTYISKIESGKMSPSVDVFYKYVQAIGKRVEIV